jgi:N4-(beta-N-acetylglucosaminyl)-L-asparaginase
MVGSHLVVELMRQGKSPGDACRTAVERIVKRNSAKAKEIQVGFVALSKAGEFGGYSLQPGFTITVSSNQHNHESQRIASHFS